jgi:tetratricopeptide (TPR) repeat protein
MTKVKKGKRKFVQANGVSIYIYLSLLVIIPLILNWKNIHYEFTMYDDTSIITNNYGFLNDFRNVSQAFEKDNFMVQKGKGYYRPIQTVSFMVDTQISGGEPYVYHFSNILYHILTVIVLFFLLRKLRVRDSISFFISLLFSVHPLFTDAIAWIPGRGDLLAGLFCSVSYLAFLYYNSTKNKWYFFFHSTAFILALFSKEISVFLPAIIILYYWVVLKNRYKIRELVPFIFVWSFSVCLFFLLRHLYVNNQDILSFKAFISNLPVIPVFLSKLVIPLGLSSMPVYEILYIIIGLTLFILSGFFIWKLKAGNKSLIILGIVWFLGFIIPAMFVVLPFTKFHFEYLECRAYLPSIGIFIAMGVLLNETMKGRELNILLKCFIPIILIFSAISYNYSWDFADGISFNSSLIKSNPANAFAFDKRGCVYLNTNSPDLAIADFDNSIKFSPTFSDPYYNKGVIYGSMNDHIKAERYYSIALKYDTLYPESAGLNEYAYINLSLEKLNLKKYDEMIALLKAGIRKYPYNCDMHNNLSNAYYNCSKFDSALYENNRVIDLEKGSYLYYHNRGMTKIKLNDYEGAISDFTKAISIKADLGSAWYFRGIAFSKLNKQEEAKENMNRALELGYKGKVKDE